MRKFRAFSVKGVGGGFACLKVFFFYQKALISIFSKWKSEKSAITAAEGGGKPNGKCPIFFPCFLLLLLIQEAFSM